MKVQAAVSVLMEEADRADAAFFTTMSAISVFAKTITVVVYESSEVDGSPWGEAYKGCFVL